jgi:NAD-reducing hydrogenase large subunit
LRALLPDEPFFHSLGVLNRLEASILAFDPCLSCSTHAFGQMPLHVLLIGPGGNVLDEARRTG